VASAGRRWRDGRLSSRSRNSGGARKPGGKSKTPGEVKSRRCNWPGGHAGLSRVGAGSSRKNPPRRGGPGGNQAVDEEIPTELRAALDEARERAELSIGGPFADPAMLSSDAFAQRLGVSRETVNQKRKRFEVLGLDGKARGFRYPEWQLIHGRPISRLRELFARLE
jgi:hypothetical protein